jgi:5'-3' exonuclease
LNIEETENQITISGKNYVLNVNKSTGLLENVKVGEEVLIKSGPFINLRIPGRRVQYSTVWMQDYAENWKLSNFSFEIKDGIAQINTEGSYDSISAKFEIKFDENGVFNIGYEVKNRLKEKTIQEAGLKFLVGDNFQKLAWDRESYFTAYPENHMGRPVGEVDIHLKPEMKYREKPQHDWEMDSKGFYYFGLSEELPYTNIVRSLKENIYSFSLQTENAKIEVLSDGKQACRFDKINAENTLIINDEWDYNSLLWGNYMKNIKLENDITGNVIFSLQRR